jgi:hypothetical protein
MPNKIWQHEFVNGVCKKCHEKQIDLVGKVNLCSAVSLEEVAGYSNAE